MRIAVRLPGEVITFVDSEVSQIRIPSRRAAVVLRASNASDAAILTATEHQSPPRRTRRTGRKASTNID